MQTTSIKYTTIALSDNQYLKHGVRKGIIGHEEYFEGYTNGKYDKKISGFYFIADIKVKR